MKRPRLPRFLPRLALLLGALGLAAVHAPPTGAGQTEAKRQEALRARQQAQALDVQASGVRSRLAGAQRALLEANQSYFSLWSQVKTTEARLVTQRHRRFLITERYNRRRILFGRRLAAMQRSGSMDYLQLFLGSRTLSDLSRRAYLFRALMQRDATLQSQLRSDKAELDALANTLSAQWNRRNALRQGAYRERARIQSAAGQQAAELRRLVSSRDALRAFDARRVEEVKALNQAVLDYNARAQAQAIAQARAEEAEERDAARRAREAEAERSQTRWLRRRYRYASDSRDESDEAPRAAPRSTRRASFSRRRRYSERYVPNYEDATVVLEPRTYRSNRRARRYRSSRRGAVSEPRMVRVRVAERVDRVRRVPTLGGSLRPMSIPEIVFKEKSVPITSASGSSSGSSDSGGSNAASGTSAGGGTSDDFPASDP